jgi:hypothetical protein
MRALLLSAALMLSGCYKIDYMRSAPASPVPTSQQWHHIGILALVEFSDPVPLQTICPTGFARVHHEVSIVNGLVTMVLGSLTGGIVSSLYQPSTISVYCNSGQAFDVQVDDSGMAVAATRTQ